MSAAGEPGEKERFVVLDGMRGLAALAVITDHVPSPWMDRLIPGRYLAVDFFFILSGFVLSHVYSKRLASGMSTFEFMRVRAIRLYPLYLVAILIGASIALIYALKGWSGAPPLHVATSLLFAFFLIPSPPGLSIWPNAPFPLNGPSWSLFFELFVNLVFALIFKWLTPARTLAISVIAGLLLIPSVFSLGGQLDGGYAWSNFIGGFPHVTFAFFMGVWIYQMRERWKLPALPAWAAYLGLMLVFAVPATGFWRSVYDLSAAFLWCPLLVAFAADARVSGNLKSASLFVGAMSYGVYVLHVPIWAWLRVSLEEFAAPDAVPGLVKVALTAVIALTATAILTRVYDVPVRRFLSRRRAAAT